MDAIIPWLREPEFWVPVYIFIIAFAVFNFGRRGYYLIVFLALTVGSADFISNTGFKKNVERIRPCRALAQDEVVVRVRCGSGYSFTSNHAANHFAISFFLIFLLPRRAKYVKWVLAFWATIVAFAQVYVGVHYPLDVICGAFLGALLAYVGSQLYYKFSPALHRRGAI